MFVVGPSRCGGNFIPIFFPLRARARREDVEGEAFRFGGIQKNRSSICFVGGEEAVAADE